MHEFYARILSKPAGAALIVLASLASGHLVAQPANDGPCAAIPLAPDVNCINTSGTNVSATATAGVPAPGCAGYAGGDVWYTVTVPASGQFTVTTSTNGGFTDSGLAFYTAASCAGPFTLAGCDNNSGPGNMSMLTYTGAAGTVVYVRVWENGNNSFGTFNICATTPPVNNDPCGATAVSVTAGCSFATFSNTSANTTTGPPAPGCGSFAGAMDVWFTFTAPATGIVIIETQAGTMADAAMALYYDAPPPGCAGPFTLVQCDDNSGPGNMPYLSFTTLTPGGTYYLRVWGSGGASGTFGLCLHGPASVPAGDCVYMLELFDTFGDGWGSSSVDISINGGGFTSYGLSSSYNIILIGLNIGDVLAVQYTATGPNQGQNSYALSFFPGGAFVFSSGSPPLGGISYTGTIDCIPPPAPPQDCSGGIGICSGQSFNNTSTNTGNVVDLNASNHGCLASDENQGTWYYFSPSASGTVGFMIDPVGTDDYDFAVWGPMGAVTCPPSGPPVRCSWALPFGPCPACYNTGLGNGAADVSEGAGGNGWVAPLTVTAGQVFVLYIDNYSTTGQAFNLSWTLGGGASLDCTVLPVELLNLEAVPVRDAIDVLWRTASEMENARFEVERSYDGDQFTFVGAVDGAGTTNQETFYQLTDPDARFGVNYYRLKQVDTDGHFEYSYVVSAFMVGEGISPILYPSPGSEEVHLFLPEGFPDAALVMLDATGRVVLTSSLGPGGNTIDTHMLPRAAYGYRIHDANHAVISRGTWLKH